jgi:hypothetical protein
MINAKENKLICFRMITARFVILVSALCLFVYEANSQSPRPRKKTRKPVAVQTMAAPTTEPVIISRADDFPADTPVLSTNVENAIRAVGDADAGNNSEKTIAELTERIKALESSKKDDYDQKQKRLAMNLEILTKAEQRVESLRKQSFEMLDKENSIKAKLEQIENDLRPESIDRNIAFIGSLRPEELRATRKKNLEAERTNLQNMLAEVQRTRSNLDLNVQKAELLVEKLRTKLESEIDAALKDDPSNF